MEPTSLRNIVALALTLTSFGAHAIDSASVERLLEGDPKMIVVGENHRHRALAKGVTDLLRSLRTKAEFDCVFLELPSDTQAALSKSIEAGDIEDVASVIVESKLEPTLSAYRKLGFDESYVTSARAALVSNPVGAITRHPVDSDFVSYVRAEKIQVIAMDSESTSAETEESIYHSARRTVVATPEAAIESVKSFDVRSRIMVENVVDGIEEFSCRRSVLVVGYAHLFKPDYVRSWGGSGDLRPLQSSLTELGIDSRVVIAEEGTGVTTLISDSDSEDRFDSFFGRLLIAP